MAGIDHSVPSHKLLDSDLEQLMKDARRAGAQRFQTLALVRHAGDYERVLLLNHPADLWSLPLAWVHSGETVPGALDWLCDIHLGLSGWTAQFTFASLWELPDDGSVMQLVFDITIPEAGEPVWRGNYQWWHVHEQPPPLYISSRPVLEQRFHIPPEF